MTRDPVNGRYVPRRGGWLDSVNDQIIGKYDATRAQAERDAAAGAGRESSGWLARVEERIAGDTASKVATDRQTPGQLATSVAAGILRLQEMFRSGGPVDLRDAPRWVRGYISSLEEERVAAEAADEDDTDDDTDDESDEDDDDEDEDDDEDWDVEKWDPGA